ncbi:tyrosine-type recombinase/integrase [filamentous cyanobacterium LEGE 11480]|uniref:Tyrosine-type recombinase/integrase n=1 Tax=Romeriopsis navalis LEGE 11480 TaxID=2777977 RepID=A0A928Z492_9CYAN|nr:tyrosine-type recombinase/integrase [Romeriopsis navalis]MBE9030797.1 tyrosine-type recombinase/integrase [Romeriopsis navalis LEGE 11480]
MAALISVVTDPIANAIGEPHIIHLREARIDEFLQAKSLSRNSQRAYRQDLKIFCAWYDARRSSNGHGAWESITARQVIQFKTDRSRCQAATHQRRLSDATIRRTLGTLRNFYNWMQRMGYVTHNPAAAIDLPKLAEPPIQHLSDQQVQHIFAAAIDTQLPERNLALLWVLNHNLRAGEVCALNYADYDGQRLTIRQAKANSTGIVPLNLEARAWLDTYLKWREAAGEHLQSSNPLFLSYSRQNCGDRLGYGGIRNLMDKLSATVGFKFHAHQFRHTYATNLMLKGMNPHHIMTLTRHKSPQNFRRYSKAAEQLAAERAFYNAIGETDTPSDIASWAG